MKRFRQKSSGIIFGILVLLVSWSLLAWLMNSPAVPGPSEALRSFWRHLLGDMLPHFGISTFRVVTSLAIGLLIAAPLGLLVGRSPRADSLLAPIVYLTYPIPKIALLPVVFVLLGTGTLSKVALISIIVCYEIFVTARDASRSIPSSAILSARSLGTSQFETFWHVVLPGSMPGVFTGLRVSTGHAIAVLFFAETVAGVNGLGYMVIDAWSRIEYAEMFAAVLAMALLGISLYLIIDFAEARICRWTEVS